MSARSKSRKATAFLLILPLLAFIGAFFVWPLATILVEAVSDASVSNTLPRTAAVLREWDKQGLPPEAAGEALVTDIRNNSDAQALGDVVRRLNSAQPGFRTLMNKTVLAVTGQPEAIDLAAIDKRWSDVAFWRAIAVAAPPYTDRNLLAALDLGRDANGAITDLAGTESANRAILIRTFAIAGMVTGACVVLGLPFAMIAASSAGWRRQAMLGAVLLPLWTSLLVRTAAWYILLQDKGLINDLLRLAGLGPVPLIFNRLGVVIAMTHVLLPFMVLPIYSVLIAIPGSLMPAAASLGANPVRAFLHVQLPLALRGVASGALLVFMSAIGYYITPALIGGARDQMISSVIAFYAIGSANWGMAAALGIVLLVVTTLLYAVYNRLSASPVSGA
ncbi:ABC transporter permease [Mesorhizobium sp. CO1-1-8]|uniref:ABC transporter permease n=1 Tax=Mesorhizobium sp. CO1-1-8 TaxID=2876631 RepID=UPI001CD133CC|nr:ABC transporter permease [Mesorhizobium sp. CO1-1-8]MBZ9772513.1 ABC transporter permease [Mesorhizobium sp. CO1-1-8]